MSCRGWSGDANPLLEPSIYRAIIDDVINAMKPEFGEYGVSEDVLADLQHVSRLLESLSRSSRSKHPDPRSEMGDQGHCISRRRLRGCKHRSATGCPATELSSPPTDDSSSLSTPVSRVARTWSDSCEDRTDGWSLPPKPSTRNGIFHPTVAWSPNSYASFNRTAARVDVPISTAPSGAPIMFELWCCC